MPGATAVAPAPTDARTRRDFWYDDEWYVPPAGEKIPKTDARANYRKAVEPNAVADDTEACYNCRFYNWGTCNMVEGTVEANYVCDLFTQMPVIYPRNMTEVAPGKKSGRGSWALFIESKRGFADAPEWVHWYPAPGRFNHPEYGEIVITADRNQRIVDNYHNSGYQKQLPIDVDHDLAFSGAVGWITDMRIIGEGQFKGGVEAKVDWTDNGKALIGEDRFRYFSPSLLPLWPHTVSGELIPDVAIGGAICTHPYFKDSWLRPLVASEGGELTAVTPTPSRSPAGTRTVRTLSLRRVASPEESTERMTTTTAAPTEQATTTVPPVAQTMTEADITAFREFQAAGGATAFKAQGDKITELATKLTESDNATKRANFTAMVEGRTKDDAGHPWVGELADHIDMLMHLSDTSGDDTTRLDKYVANQRAVAAQQKISNTFKIYGEGPTGDTNTATEQVTALVNQRMSEDTSDKPEAAKRSAAMSYVSRNHTKLYKQYRAESAKTKSGDVE